MLDRRIGLLSREREQKTSTNEEDGWFSTVSAPYIEDGWFSTVSAPYLEDGWFSTVSAPYLQS